MRKRKIYGEIVYERSDGIIHNPHGPAKIADGYKAYLLNGRWKNIVGPARIFQNGEVHYVIDSVFI